MFMPQPIGNNEKIAFGPIETNAFNHRITGPFEHLIDGGMGMAMGFGMETGRQGRIVMEGTREEIANNEKVQSTYLGIKVS